VCRLCRLALVALIAGLCGARTAVADEGGMSFWLPGSFGSYAAAPSDPGWSLQLLYYHANAGAPPTSAFTNGDRIMMGVAERADVLYFNPQYALPPKVLGAQLSLSVEGGVGVQHTSANVLLESPGGPEVSGYQSDAHAGITDIFPMVALKWEHEVHHFMPYVTAGVPVGTYSSARLANLGTNHWALDGGGGYTFVERGSELSAVLGLTGNFRNPASQYTNGLNGHLDWAASQTFADHFLVGMVGYAYVQLTGDSGPGARLGAFKSKVLSVGPQAALLLPVADLTWSVSLKGYWEFYATNRPSGWNSWLTLTMQL
jgi:hypothetical protein